METTEIIFLGSVAGYRMTDHNRNEDTVEELKVTDSKKKK
jgi:hypothetical protein